MLADVSVSLATVVIVVGPVTKAPFAGLMKFSDSGVVELFKTLNAIGAEVVELPAASNATAVNATEPFGTVV